MAESCKVSKTWFVEFLTGFIQTVDSIAKKAGER